MPVNESFSLRTKAALREIPVKKKCCRKLLELCAGLIDEDGEAPLITDAREQLQCGGCESCLIRGLFLRFGSVTDPAKQYHLEFSVAAVSLADQIEIFLGESGIPPKRTERKGRQILYYKESAQLEDLLALIGANTAAFDVMNGKIVKEMRSGINRQVNCDTHNIQSSLKAAAEQIRVLERLRDSGKMDLLPPEYRETAELRLANPQASLTELGALSVPEMTKSGINHRLTRLVSAADEILNRE